jgi:hypothetical protein
MHQHFFDIFLDLVRVNVLDHIPIRFGKARVVAALTAGDHARHDRHLVAIGDQHRAETACRDHSVVNSYKKRPAILVSKTLGKTLIEILRQERFHRLWLGASRKTL